jgi:hypothetical protein
MTFDGVLRSDAKIRNQFVTTRTGALQPFVHPISGQSFTQWLAANPQAELAGLAFSTRHGSYIWYTEK